MATVGNMTDFSAVVEETGKPKPRRHRLPKRYKCQVCGEPHVVMVVYPHGCGYFEEAGGFSPEGGQPVSLSRRAIVYECGNPNCPGRTDDVEIAEHGPTISILVSKPNLPFDPDPSDQTGATIIPPYLRPDVEALKAFFVRKAKFTQGPPEGAVDETYEYEEQYSVPEALPPPPMEPPP
jgi:transcription elongation factor Elf1